jgi:hypothetical protein
MTTDAKKQQKYSHMLLVTSNTDVSARLYIVLKEMSSTRPLGELDWSTMTLTRLLQDTRRPDGLGVLEAYSAAAAAAEDKENAGCMVARSWNQWDLPVRRKQIYALQRAHS